MPQFLEFYNVEFAKALFIMVELLLVTFVDDIYRYMDLFFLLCRLKNYHQVLLMAGLKPII